jgi:hypothetical protein
VLHLDHHRRVHLRELRLVHPALEIRHRGGRREGGDGRGGELGFWMMRRRRAAHNGVMD